MQNRQHTPNTIKHWIERKTHPHSYGCIITQHNQVIAEWYGGEFSAESLFEIGSIRKAFNSALIGKSL